MHVGAMIVVGRNCIHAAKRKQVNVNINLILIIITRIV